MTTHEFTPLPDGPLNVDTENSFKPLRNKLQMYLMQEGLKEKGIDDDTSAEGFEFTQAWVKKYSEKFKKIFHRHVIANPHLKEDAATIPDAVYEEMKLELYHDDQHVNPEEYIDVGDNEHFDKAA